MVIGFRVKYWYLLTGANIILTMVAASGHSTGFMFFGVAMSMGCWYMAEYLLSKEENKCLSSQKTDDR